MSPSLNRTQRLLVLAAVFGALLVLPAVAAAATHIVRWNRSVLLDNPNRGGGLDAVSCAPTLAGSRALLCVAGDVRGDVLVSEHPARGAAFWRRQVIDPPIAITGVSCPSTTLCVAVDAHGQVMHTLDPLGGAKYWTHPRRIDKATQTGGGFAGLAAISCPTTTLCVAVDNSPNGQVAVTTDPTGPASAWTLTPLGSGVTLDAVNCVSATFCMVGGTDGYYSTDPTGGASAWKAVTSLSSSDSVIASLDCNTLKLCIGVGYGNAGAGLATASSTPTAATWTNSIVGSDPPALGAGVLDSVACPLRNFCVAADAASNVYTTNFPVRGHWSVARPLKRNSQATLSQIACNQTICVEVDNRGTVTYGLVKALTPSKTTTATTPTATATTPTTTSATGTTTTSTAG